MTRPKGTRGGLVGSKRYICDITIGSESSLSLALSAFCFLYLSLSLSVVLSLALSFCGHPRLSKWSSKARFTDKSVRLWAAQMHKCSDKFIRVSDSSLEAPWRLNVVRANISEVLSRS